MKKKDNLIENQLKRMSIRSPRDEGKIKEEK